MKFIVALLTLFLTTLVIGKEDDLPAFNVDKNLITLSGISAGACFATQFHVAYSSIIAGAGMWAGVPYLCYAKNALLCMSSPSIINVGSLVTDTEKLANSGDIDLPSNLHNSRVYIAHGTKDTTVRPVASEKMEEYYLAMGMDPSSILKKTDLDATHCVMNDHDGVSGQVTRCGVTNSHTYIENCDYHSVHDMLDHLLGGGLSLPTTPGTMLGTLTKFNQSPFFNNNPEGSSMADSGFLYVPPSCSDGTIQCRLHVHFHGCSMYQDNILNDFILDSGFIEMADDNNIVLIFPQTIAKPLGGNPYGCFNWFGYLSDSVSENFAKKSAKQMEGLYRLIAQAAQLT